MKTVLTVVLLGSILLVLSWCCVSPRNGAGPAPAPPRAADPALTHRETTLEGGADSPSRAAVASVATTPSPSADDAELDDDALTARLRAVQRAFVAQKSRDVEMNVEFLLEKPTTPRRVLAGLSRGFWARDDEAREGAILTAGLAVAHDVRSTTLVVGNRTFIADFLDALVEIPSPEAEKIADFTAGLRVDERPVVGVKWLTTILNLRERFPSHAEVYTEFLDVLLANPTEMKLAESELPALALVASESRDPLAVEIALAVLLESDPANFLAIAEDMHRQAANDPRVAAAIVRAIALHAPVRDAAESLARLADSTQYGEFARFGDRPGGMREAQNEYSRLVASDANPKARRMLVAAMAKEKPEVLIGIAETDPNRSVRHQALLVVSLRPLEDEAVMRTVRGRHALRGDASNGLTTQQSLSVADNVALNSKGKVRDDAVAFMIELVTDASEKLDDRKAAWASLKERATRDELAGVAAPPR